MKKRITLGVVSLIVHATTLVAFGAPLSDGGNTFGAPASVGTNDNFDMRIRTNNANRVVIKTDGRVGIGTNAPGATLEVAGTVKFTGGAPGAGKVLTSDAAGLASWLAPTGVTSVNSANLYLSVANTTTTPIITANVGTLANTLAAGNDSRITNALQSSVYAADLAPVTSCAPSSKPSWNTITDLWECNSIGSLNASVLSSGTVDSARLGSGLASPTTFLRGDGTWATPSPAINIATGTGLIGGPITSSGTISLANTAVVAGLYGSATQVAQFTVDSQGRIVSANNVPLPGGVSSQWTTSGSDIYYNLGSVGIGTSAPTKKLDVVGGDAKINGVAIGKGAAGINFNTALGVSALGSSSTTGDANVGVGYLTLSSLTTGNGNVAAGHTALQNATTGGSNVGIGIGTLNSTTSGQLNVAIGALSMNLNTTGEQNVAIGYRALENNNVTAHSVAIGTYALMDYNNATAFTSTYNTAIGVNAGRGITTGVENTIIGANTSGLPANLTRNIIVADGAGNQRINVNSAGNVGLGVGNATSKLQVAGVITPSLDAIYNLGDSILRFSAVYAQNGTINTSDAREKKNVLDSDLGLEFVTKLRPVSYNWKKGQDQNIHYGLIAQEVEKLLLQAKGSQSAGAIVSHDKLNDRYGIRYAELISPLIKAVQELDGKVLAESKEYANLKKENAELKQRLEAIEKMLQK